MTESFKIILPTIEFLSALVFLFHSMMDKIDLELNLIRAKVFFLGTEQKSHLVESMESCQLYSP